MFFSYLTNLRSSSLMMWMLSFGIYSIFQSYFIVTIVSIINNGWYWRKIVFLQLLPIVFVFNLFNYVLLLFWFCIFYAFPHSCIAYSMLYDVNSPTDGNLYVLFFSFFLLFMGNINFKNKRIYSTILKLKNVF